VCLDYRYTFFRTVYLYFSIFNCKYREHYPIFQEMKQKAMEKQSRLMEKPTKLMERPLKTALVSGQA